MSIPIQLFENFIINNASKPDIYYYDYRKFIEPNDNFIISRNHNGEVLSTYSDNIWDLTPYAPGLNQSYKFHFYKNLKNKKNILQLKKFFFLIMVVGSPFKNEIYSVTTLSQTYKILSHIAEFAENINISFNEILSNTNELKKFISKYQNRKRYLGRLTSVLLFLDKTNNNLTGVSFKRDEKLLNYLRKIIYDESKNNKQTEVIPSKIFIESTKERWIQIKEIEENINKLSSFILKIINCKYFAASNKFESLEYKSNENYIVWKDAVKNYKLSKLFMKYNVTNKLKLKKFVREIQGTCNHLIHTYTGMRRSEVLSLKINCLRKIDNNKVRIIGITTKFETGKKLTEWVTTYEIEKVINLLDKLSEVLSTKLYFSNKNDRYLFISTTNLSSKIPKQQKIVSTSFSSDECLTLSKNATMIDEEALKELESIEYDRNWRKEKEFQIGNHWRFKTHQYRRTLAVYSIQSGIVSLGSVKNQFKHLFREMTYYYQKNCINAKNLLEISGNHISKEINIIKPEINFLTFLRDIINSEEKIFTAQEEFKNLIYSEKPISFENREKLMERFKRNEISWQENALGGCVESKPCDAKLSKSLIECIGCNMAIHKISKLEKTIFHMERFIDTLTPDSIEYRTEMYDLNILRNYLDKLYKKE